MCTTYAVEAVHRQFRKLAKTKGDFPAENSLLKLLYVGMLQALRMLDAPSAELESNAITAVEPL